ncbi:ATP-binding protein [Elizabethkingia meningoseptica]|uniref:AAA family ATPase n=1 Tax=Elizabethkingia meningoseptica TaxID=238 RepID=UPI0022F180C8|nr:AAA family ATPase [Elizabethkingia meningoseptica]EJK5327776.1 AAA family ATPase [Elizabethkingia meningoseptica]MDE5436349.1 ATP-binding protein [Elizabethkingia meningoseptica]MDE5508451.1 ATP-binding protein [Elizabethkingia meningoseptica]MDE5515158.1 ATP-binding protein [Elizabethkingia meningoseptica]MDE5529424.1 ATP-binding protein [Elizabethkingia meningoseptica]
MNKINNVKITNFWGDKSVNIDFDKDINFLIGVNGSGKTTIINLIAATLTADFKTLDKIQFEKIEITLFPRVNSRKKLDTAIIMVEKKPREFSPFPQINYQLKNYDSKNFRQFNLDDIEEDQLYRYQKEILVRERLLRQYNYSNDINIELEKMVNVSWLSIHRMSGNRRRDDKSYESTIDQKIEELQIDLVKYFSQLNRKYAIETEKFQKYIFESLIDISHYTNTIENTSIDANKEKESLKSIFDYFKVSSKNYSEKLDKYFIEYNIAIDNAKKNDGMISIKDFSFILGIKRIHAVVEEWNGIILKQTNINKNKEVFLTVINNLLQRKSIFINEKNELTVKTQSGKKFPLTNLSSGEKQLLIIFGQSLLQEEDSHIYIADEPELSLHIEWQEKLVNNLKSINPNSQIIFATHSPDIVSEYEEYVLKIEDTIK